MTVRLSVVVSPSNGVERTARTGGVKPVHEMTATRSRAPPASVIQREPHLHRHLPVRDLAVLHVPTRVQDLEPADVANGLRRALDGREHGVIDAFGGGTGQLGRLVDVVAHGSAHSGWNASLSLPAGPVTTPCRQARQSPGQGLRSCAGPELLPTHRPVRSASPRSSMWKTCPWTKLERHAICP